MLRRFFPCVLVLCLGWALLSIAQVQAAPISPLRAPHEAGPFDCSPPNQTQIPQIECEALVALYTSTNGPGWSNHAGWLETNTPCSWVGVICEGGHVGELHLPGNELTGTLPPELGNLVALRILQLSINTLSGPLPPSLGTLTALTYLGLGYNSLSGPIPSSFEKLINLTNLYLNNNQLTGQLPIWLGDLSALVNLFLGANEFSGPIPAALGGLSALEQLQLGGNNLTGEIPTELGQLTALQGLVLAENRLTGPIPGELGSLSSLTTLNLISNTLEGPIPQTFSQLKALKMLGLTKNKLSGPIPEFISELDALGQAHLALNHFSGSLPELGSSNTLTWTNLYGNQLEGHLGADLCALVGYRIDHNLFTSAAPCITPDWISTQTIPPSNLTATLLSPAGVRLTWTSIPYTGDGGYYEILGAAPGEAYTLLGQTASKFDTGWTVPGTALPSAGAYCFIVRTFTPPHAENPNALTSEPTPEVCVDLGEEPVPPLLALYALAFDTPLEHDLSWGYPTAMQGLRAASEAGNKRVVALVDLPGNDNTFIYIFQAGQATFIRGLPDPTGTLTTTLDEYDMTDGATLGGFLLWARQAYPTSGPTTFSYVGHGGPLIPAAHYDLLFDPPPPPAPFAPRGASPLFPLPVRIDANPEFTDITPRRSLLSVHHLSEALRIGTQNGAAPFAVVDLVKCMSGTIEELYALADYATTLTSSPNYSFFAPKMLGQGLAALNPAAPPETLAATLITQYDSVIATYDDEPKEPTVHPRSLVALSTAPLHELKSKWDEVSYYLMLSLTHEPQLTTQRMEAAYRQSAHYDTTYCDADWALAVPDAVVDLDSFAAALFAQFDDPAPVRVPLISLRALLDAAVLANPAHEGSPWFAEGDPAPTWNFANTAGSGIGLYADLVGQTATHEGVTGQELSWQAHFYTDTVSEGNPHPYTFLQGGFLGAGWDELFERYWELRDERLHTAACLPNTPPPLSTGELSAVSLPLPRAATITAGAPVYPVVIVRTSEVIVAPTVAFTITQKADGQPERVVFTDTVQVRHWVTGTHPLPVSQGWTPTLITSTAAELFTLTVMVDPANRVREQNEADNVLTLSNVVAPAPATPRPILDASMTDDLQWVHTPTVRLDVTQRPGTDTAPVTWVGVEVYQYAAGSDPSVHLPVHRGSITHTGQLPSSPLTLTLPPTVQPGATILMVWGWSTGGVSIWHPGVVVLFNYAPPNASIAAEQSHFYFFQAAQDDHVGITLDVAEGGNADLYAWDPHDFGSPNAEWGCAAAPGDDTITIASAPFTGEYTLEVRGTSHTTYTLTTTRNGTPDSLGVGSSPCESEQGTLLLPSRPTFVAPIPVEPAPPFTRFLPLTQR